MRIPKRLEDIFSHAVALTQSGRLRSTVYCLDEFVYILNQDHTVLLQFTVRKGETFSESVSFHANDYDSSEVEVKDGQIHFIQEGAGFERVKSCRTPNLKPEDVGVMFEGFRRRKKNRVQLHRDVLSLLDPALSHVEFSARKGKLRIIQRNIYTGSVLRLSREEGRGLGLKAAEDLDDFDPIGLRTDDLMALFSFLDSLDLYFPGKGYAWADSGEKLGMKAIVSQCKYDELGGTEGGKPHGRKVKKVRRRKQSSDQ